ncbi:general substrate transporter [Xylariales sp. AK1849]|nr:general substrate transporter [Xylariales sp. AK1849]
MGILSRWRSSDLGKELTGPLIAVCGYAGLAGAGFGWDNCYWAGFLGMEKFAEDFGVLDQSTGRYSIPASWQSAGSGAPIAGVALGCLFSGLIGHNYGRIKTFFLASAIAIVGILIQVCSFGQFWQLMAGRIINSVSMGLVCNVVPTYQSEISPAKIRGSLINIYQFWQLVGATMACVSNWGFQSRMDQWAYRVTLIIQFVIPIILVVGGCFLPESPRWLTGQGRIEDARKVLHFLRRGTPIQLIDEELNLLVQAERQDRELYEHTSWPDVFRGPNLRRTLISAGVQCLQQAQGSSFIVQYAVVFLQTIGVTNSFEILIYLYMVNCLSSILAFHFVDRIGRRPLMISGACLLSACMFIVASLTGFYGDEPGAQKGALACLFVWQFVQAISWASCVWIVCAEVPTLAVREKTITVATFSGFSTNVLITFVSPYIQDAGYGNLQGEIGFVWGAGSIIAALWAFFVLPELKGRSLEELDEIFQKHVGVFDFGKFQTTGAGATLTVIEGMAHDLDKKSAALVIEDGLDKHTEAAR